MAKRLSRHFGVSALELKKLGVFNAFLGIDNQLFVDPNLLKAAKTQEFVNARANVEGHFRKVIQLIKASSKKNDLAWSEARKRLMFHEEHGIALGYSRPGNYGNAVGWTLGSRLLERAAEIVRMGIVDPEIFELIGWFEEGFGADRLSDATVDILRPTFLAYTQRVAAILELKPIAKFNIQNKPWELPIHPSGNKPLVFAPSELLSPLPVALDWDTIEEAAALNQQLRASFNQIIAAAAKAKRALAKHDLGSLVLSRRDWLQLLIEVYRRKLGKPYDFDQDPGGLFGWDEIGREIAAHFPLKLKIKQVRSPSDLREVVHSIIRQFKRTIEDHALYEHLYDDEGSPRRERYAQRLFYSIADSWCEANDVDLSREPNPGNGPVDFKMSSGYHNRYLVELKLSSNSRLVHGFTSQLPLYQKSEATEEAAYVILRVTESEVGIKQVLKLQAEADGEGRRVPDVFVVDARPKPSASRATGA